MSKLAEFREAERLLKEQLALLEKLKNDSSLKKELEFKDQLQALMDEYGMNLRNVIDILDPHLEHVGDMVHQRLLHPFRQRGMACLLGCRLPGP